MIKIIIVSIRHVHFHCTFFMSNTIKKSLAGALQKSCYENFSNISSETSVTESSVWIASIFEQFNEFSRNSIKNFGYLLEVVQYTEKLFLFFKLQNYHFGSVNDLEVSSP